MVSTHKLFLKTERCVETSIHAFGHTDRQTDRRTDIGRRSLCILVTGRLFGTAIWLAIECHSWPVTATLVLLAWTFTCLASVGIRFLNSPFDHPLLNCRLQLCAWVIGCVCDHSWRNAISLFWSLPYRMSSQVNAFKIGWEWTENHRCQLPLSRLRSPPISLASQFGIHCAEYLHNPAVGHQQFRHYMKTLLFAQMLRFLVSQLEVWLT